MVHGGKPIITIVIDDRASTRRMRHGSSLAGPAHYRLHVLSTELQPRPRRARAAGDEIWMRVPMEPMDGEINAGTNVLKVNLRR